MEISYLGGGSARVAGRNVSIVSNPQEGAGKKSTADVSLIMNGPNEFASGLVIDTPGEYEVRGVMITGVSGPSYVIQGEDISVGLLGPVAGDLDAEASEQLSELDALLIPVGETLDAAAAAVIIGKLEPKYVIPLPKTKEDLSKFLAEMGATAGEAQTKLKVSTKDLPEETTVVVLDQS